MALYYPFLYPCLFPARTGAIQSHEHIAWSSSDSEQSDDEGHEQHPSKVVTQQQQLLQRPRRPTAPIQDYSRAKHMLSPDKGKLLQFAESWLGCITLFLMFSLYFKILIWFKQLTSILL